MGTSCPTCNIAWTNSFVLWILYCVDDVSSVKEMRLFDSKQDFESVRGAKYLAHPSNTSVHGLRTMLTEADVSVRQAER